MELLLRPRLRRSKHSACDIANEHVHARVRQAQQFVSPKWRLSRNGLSHQFA
jgi:hypothetical protein